MNRALEWFRGTSDVKAEMDEMQTEHAALKQIAQVDMKEMIVNPALRAPLIIAMMMMLGKGSSINHVDSWGVSVKLPFYYISKSDHEGGGASKISKKLTMWLSPKALIRGHS